MKYDRAWQFTIKLIWTVAAVLAMLSCGCKSDRFELKHAEYQQFNGNVLCEPQGLTVTIETSDEYNRDAIGRFLANELSVQSDGRIKGEYAPMCGTVITNDNFVKVVFKPNYSGGPGVNAGLAFGLVGAFVGETMRDRSDYAARYSGVVESRLKGRPLVRKEFDLTAIFMYEPGTVNDEEMIAEGRNKFKTMTFRASVAPRFVVARSAKHAGACYAETIASA